MKVLVGGCFDILHIGHIEFLKKAKALGDKLVVILEPDTKVKLLKGVNRPINNQKIRKKILLSLKSVDEVIILPYLKTFEDYHKVVSKIKPNIIAVTYGSDNTQILKRHAKLISAKIVKIPKTKSASTSEIVTIIQSENP